MCFSSLPLGSLTLDDATRTEHAPTRTAEQSIYITTGGGPGFMEAANKGAAQVRKEGYTSIHLSIAGSG